MNKIILILGIFFVGTVSYCSFFLSNTPVVYAHTIPMITADPGKLSPGDTLTVYADGMPEAGAYAVSLESELNTVALGSTEIAQGNDSFEADFVLQQAAPPGSYTVKVLHGGSNRTFYSIAKFAIFTSNQSLRNAEESSGDAVPLPNTYTPIELMIVAFVLGLAALGGVALARAKP